MSPHDHATDHSHDHANGLEEFDTDAMLTRDFWEDRYRTADQIWSGNPNPRLVEQVADLAPGRALDVGCGEGADAIWLAQCGWTVVGADVSQVALDRGKLQGELLGTQVSSLLDWQQRDFLTWEPPTKAFDLVSAQFMHLPPELLKDLHRRLAASVAPGGTLLIVGHHPSDLHTKAGRPHNLADFMFTPDQVVNALDTDDWTIAVAAEPQRKAKSQDGDEIEIRDTVVRAVRK